MDRDNRQQLSRVVDELGGWVKTARAVQAARLDARASAADALATLRGSLVEVRVGPGEWRVLPLLPSSHLYSAIAVNSKLSAMSPTEDSILERLVSEIPQSLHDVRSILGARRFFSGRTRAGLGHAAAGVLTDFHQRASDGGLPATLRRLTAAANRRAPTATVDDMLSDRIGVSGLLRDLGPAASFPARDLNGLDEAVALLKDISNREASLRSAAVEAGNEVRRAETSKIILAMPVERLREATADRLRIGLLTDAGITTVGQVLRHGNALNGIPGIGPTSATRMLGAAQTILKTTYDEMPARIDLKARGDETTNLLRSLAAWDGIRRAGADKQLLCTAAALSGLAATLARRPSAFIAFSSSNSPVSALLQTVSSVKQRAQALLPSAERATPAPDPWADFLKRPADYFALLSELGFLSENEERVHGDLSDEIIAATRELELRADYLTASLRGYQSFAARFAVVQRKVIIGDEMGLGKTVEALAVLAHLRSHGESHFLTICPAAVVTNWTREVRDKTRLSAHRLHGTGREAAARNWRRGGGVAVTTFESLGWLIRSLDRMPEIGCIVVDEAHYIKNPVALRSQRTVDLIQQVDRCVLLTGTPLENRVEEFRNLVSYVRPDLVLEATDLAPSRFRRQVAPAYLRRNQTDVLVELPELVEVDEWLPMSEADQRAYRDAVAAGNFMAMRQAAIRSGRDSVKMQRLQELVREAEQNNRKVIVFSYFRDVLDQVVRSMPGRVFGPLSGTVPPAFRQRMVDEFTESKGGAVLASQIVAGGVGLNVQAASVVIICEPQLKPTVEEQAIARAHRMGQLESVQVHRLLSESSVDERIVSILGDKRRLFDEFARYSETAASTPEALDVSEAELARQVVAAERERLFAGATTGVVTDDGAQPNGGQVTIS